MSDAQNKTVLKQQKSSRFCLKIVSGPNAGQVYRIIGDAVRIGRSAANDIQIEDRNLSRSHAVILLSHNGSRIKDLESRNGVYVNSKRIKDAPLAHQDFIHIGDTELIFVEVDQMIELPAAGLDDQASVMLELAPNEINDLQMSEPAIGLNLMAGQAPLLQRIFSGRRGKILRLGLVGFLVVGGFALFVMFQISQMRQKAVADAQRRRADSLDKDASPLPKTAFLEEALEKEKVAAAKLQKFLKAVKTPSDAYTHCMDLEDLAFYREAISCFSLIEEFPGAPEGKQRVTAKMNKEAEALYREGRRLFEINYLEHARLKWQQVMLITPSDSDYYRQAAKGLATLEKRTANK